MSRFVLISPDRAFDARLRAAVAGLRGEVSAVADAVPADIEELLATEDMDVLVIGPDVPAEDALRLASIVDIRIPHASVLLVVEGDIELVVQAMRAGVRGILPPDADAARLRVELERAGQTATRQHVEAESDSSAPRPAAANGRVIGVFSPKGGVGKTTVATNIAVGLGKTAPMSVVIVDLDLQFGDVASGLDLDPEHSVTDAVSPAATLDNLVLKAFLTVHPGGIYALCAPKTPAEADEISADQVGRLLDQLATEFQYVVVDTAPGLTELGLAAMEKCTDVVWVTGLDVPSIRGLRSGLDALKQLSILPPSQHVVLNMTDSRAGLSVRDVEATIGIPVDVSIPRSRAVAFSTNRGIPVLQDARPDAGVKNMRRLVERFQPGWDAQRRGSTHRREVLR